MTPRELRRLFPNASPDCLAANASPDAQDTGEDAVVECAAGTRTLAAVQVQEAHSGRVHIRFVSVRKRLLDPDNLAEKWGLDVLRYIGAIPNDRPEDITLETTQRKAAKGEAEHTLIEIYEETKLHLPS